MKPFGLEVDWFGYIEIQVGIVQNKEPTENIINLIKLSCKLFCDMGFDQMKWHGC